MKIAFLSFYSGNVNRGVESFVHELANRLSQNHAVSVYQEGKPPNDSRYKVVRHKVGVNWDKPDTSKDFKAKLLIDYWRILILLFSLKISKSLIKGGYDVIIPSNGGWMSIVVRVVTVFLKAKVVIINHSGIGWDDRINLYTIPDRFVAISSHALLWAKRTNPLVKSVYIPNGVNTSRFKPSGSKAKTGFEGRTVLCVGALVPTKRINLLIEAVARLEDTNLLVAGDGDWKSEIQELGLKLLGPKRFKISRYSYDEMPRVYRSADVFALVSESFHSFELVIVEAMASGLGVVVNDDPIRREIVGDAGILVDPKNPVKLAQAIKKASKRNWGDVPRKQALKFDWSSVGDKYEKLMEKIIK